MFSYDEGTSTFTLTDGQTALLKAASIVLAKATGTGCLSSTDGQEDRQQFHIEKLPEELRDYVPYTQDINVESRLDQFRSGELDGGLEGGLEDEFESNSESEEDPYIVEAIVKKRFTREVAIAILNTL